MKPTPGRLGLAAVVLAALGAPFWGPPLLRHVDLFAVRRVEVSGVRLLAPHEVLAASGIGRGDNVWADADSWEAALRAHPVVESAEIVRRLPGTLRVRITEKQPVALVEAPVLRAVTAAGEFLPLDPAGRGVDLPLLRAGTLAAEPDSAARARLAPLLVELGRITQLDPAFVGRVSEVRAERPGLLRITLSRPHADVLVPVGADAVRFQQLGALLREVEGRQAQSQTRTGRAQIDLRFEDQIVLRGASAV